MFWKLALRILVTIAKRAGIRPTKTSSTSSRIVAKVRSAPFGYPKWNQAQNLRKIFLLMKMCKISFFLESDKKEIHNYFMNNAMENICDGCYEHENDNRLFYEEKACFSMKS